jgi:hypothetical protein
MARLVAYTFFNLRTEFDEGSVGLAEFHERAESVFVKMDAGAGLIDRHQGPNDHRFGPMVTPTFDDGNADGTISLWEDLESIFAETYNGLHLDAMRKRESWLKKGDWPSYTLWWVADDHMPT